MDWKNIKLKYLVFNWTDKKNYDGNFYIGLENIESWTGKIILNKTDENFVVDSVVNSFDENSILFCKLRPYLAKVAIPNFSGQCSTELLTLLPKEDIYKNFLFFVMISKGFIYEVDSSTYGTKMPRANWEFIGNIKIPLPLIEEQKEITAYLDEKCNAIDELVTKKQTLLAELESYKKSLIFEYVTGKKEVTK